MQIYENRPPFSKMLSKKRTLLEHLVPIFPTSNCVNQLMDLGIKRKHSPSQKMWLGHPVGPGPDRTNCCRILDF